jgi:APA family basic amino acid/polyamine antiporter
LGRVFFPPSAWHPYDGGPGISLLFILTAITCGFSALCYAEFASRVPIAGSAYTYAYVSFGEIVAWIIGWALILEYAIGNIVVAISWSSYFNNLLLGFHIHLPGWLITDPGSAKDAFLAAQQTLSHAIQILPQRQRPRCWTLSIPGLRRPSIAGMHVVLNLPAFFIVCIISYITYIGIRESRKATNAMVIFQTVRRRPRHHPGFLLCQHGQLEPFPAKWIQRRAKRGLGRILCLYRL